MKSKFRPEKAEGMSEVYQERTEEASAVDQKRTEVTLEVESKEIRWKTKEMEQKVMLFSMQLLAPPQTVLFSLIPSVCVVKTPCIHKYGDCRIIDIVWWIILQWES